jgi:hypothetical protein
VISTKFSICDTAGLVMPGEDLPFIDYRKLSDEQILEL